MRIGWGGLIDTAQRWWRSGADAVSRTLEHLSTGLRVARAIDDAAGLSISEGLTARITGYEQGARNAQDGVSLVQVADGGLAGIHDALQRMRTLAVEAANGTWSDTDREAMQSELDSLLDGIDGVVSGTEFNGALLLDGSVAARHIQVGAEAGDVVDLDIASFDSVGLGLRNGAPTSSGTTPTTLAASSTSPTTFTTTSTPSTSSTTTTMHMSTTTTTNTTTTTTGRGNPNAPGQKNKLTTTSPTSSATTTSPTTTTTSTTPTATTSSTSPTTATTSPTTPTTSTVGTSAGAAGGWAVSVRDVASAQEAIGVIEDAIWSVSHGRADLGAVENRLQRSMAFAEQAGVHLTAARSRIRDADVASEMSALVRRQITSEAAAAMTAQAQMQMRRSAETLLLGGA